MEIIIHQVNGLAVGQRRSDGYINATGMCVAYGKDISDWLKTDPTYELVKALADRLGIEPNSDSKPNSIKTRVSAAYPTLVVVKRGSPETGGGTWIHRKLAVPLAMWLSPEFALLVSDWIEEWLATGQNPITPQPQPQPEIQQPPEITDLLAQLQSLEHDIKVALKHRHAIHNIVEQPTLVDLSLNRIVHVAVHEQAEKLNSALAKLQSIGNVLLALQSLTQKINQYQSLWETFNSLNQMVEDLRQENGNLQQKLEQRSALLTSSEKETDMEVESQVESNYVPSLESVLSQRIKQLTAMLMATQKRTGGERAIKSCTLKATILARYQFGESMDDIAADLQIPYLTVKTYIKLARRSLKHFD